MMEAIISIGMFMGTIAIFAMMRMVYRRYKAPFLIPVLTTSICIVALLLSFNLSYDTYMKGGQYIDLLLGPAVVALAYPLYKQFDVLLKNMVPILSGVTVGAIIGMISGLLLAKMFGVDKQLILTLLPKSVTTPVAMEVADMLGGHASLTVVFVMIAGFTGVVIGPYVLKGLRVDSDLGQGIAFGSASHAIGTSKAFEYGLNTATVSSVAMTLCAIAVSIFAPWIVWLFYG
ncbi:MAG TPA: LrgB family protein [Virgibacillus sp.]|nr:LrgB family protein [Virgibacillus sp.]